MNADYRDAALPVSEGVAEAHHEALAAFARPGAWWDGADRLAIVQETRAAPDHSALGTAKADADEHDNAGRLPPVAVEAIHGIRNDSGRLTRRWYNDLIDMGLQREAYVELVSVVASSVIVDTFAQGLGLAPPSLPTAEAGAPTFESSDDVVDAGAWLPIAKEGQANILRSLGLVPSARAHFFATFGPSYYMRPNAKFAIGRRQVELVASRVSAVNQCFY